MTHNAARAPGHPTATAAYDKNHENYAKFRPGYIPESVAAVIEQAQISDKSTVAEIAVGTGLFTRELRARLPNLTIKAVEPSAGMLASFRREFPDIEAVQADAEALPLPDSSVDAVIAAQAFHWFASHAALREFARVLRPGGRVVFVWNYEDWERMPKGGWQERTVKLAHTQHDAVPQYDKREWPRAFDDQTWFAPYQEVRFPYEKVIPSREFYEQNWLTRSYITALPEAELAAFRREFNAILDEHLRPEEVNADGEFKARRGAHVVWAERLGDANKA